MTDLTIRPARPSDEASLARLAQLDSQRSLDGDVLVAEVCDLPVAAIDRATMRVIADPFRPTADVVELLSLRARGTRRPTGRPSIATRARLRAA